MRTAFPGINTPHSIAHLRDVLAPDLRIAPPQVKRMTTSACVRTHTPNRPGPEQI